MPAWCVRVHTPPPIPTFSTSSRAQGVHRARISHMPTPASCSARRTPPRSGVECPCSRRNTCCPWRNRWMWPHDTQTSALRADRAKPTRSKKAVVPRAGTLADRVGLRHRTTAAPPGSGSRRAVSGAATRRVLTSDQIRSTARDQFMHFRR